MSDTDLLKLLQWLPILEDECTVDIDVVVDDDDAPVCAEMVEGEELPFCDPPIAYGIPPVDHIIFSGPATIVFWADGTKTVVKCMEGERFEQYAGFAAACMKKMFGSTTAAKKFINGNTIDSGKAGM